MPQPLTPNERAWVERALAHRRQMIRLRQLAFWGTVLPCAFLGYIIWVVARLSDGPMGAIDIWWPLIATLLALGLIFYVWRRDRSDLTALRVGLSAKSMPDSQPQEWRGVIRVVGTDELICSVASSDRPGDGIPIQIPPHWQPYVSSSRRQLRLVEVDATGTIASLDSVIRGGMTSSGIPLRHDVTTSLYSDPKHILLGMGTLSIDGDVDAGLGLPRLRSAALVQIAMSLGIGGAFLGVFAWIGLDYFPRGAAVVLAACGVAQVPWLVLGALGVLRARKVRAALVRVR